MAHVGRAWLAACLLVALMCFLQPFSLRSAVWFGVGAPQGETTYRRPPSGALPQLRHGLERPAHTSGAAGAGRAQSWSQGQAGEGGRGRATWWVRCR